MGLFYLLFGWPPTPTEFVICIILSMATGGIWGFVFASHSFTKNIEAMSREMTAHNNRIEKIINEGNSK
jgi:hypothetical protein